MITVKTIRNLLLCSLLLAAASRPAVAAPDREMTVTAGVDGMVCSFCAQGLLAHFRKHKAVSDIHVDLDRKIVILAERKGSTITDDEVRDAIRRAGFKAGNINRSEKSFEDAKKAG